MQIRTLVTSYCRRVEINHKMESISRNFGLKQLHLCMVVVLSKRKHNHVYCVAAMATVSTPDFPHKGMKWSSLVIWQTSSSLVDRSGDPARCRYCLWGNGVRDSSLLFKVKKGWNRDCCHGNITVSIRHCVSFFLHNGHSNSFSEFGDNIHFLI